MSIMSEFKEFAMKGNVLDLAVGLIIGAEFGKIVNSLVNDVIMPPIGLIIGGIDFKNLFITLKEGASVVGPYATLADAQKAGAVTINVGLFVTSIISFTIIAFAVFLLVKSFNKIRPEPAAPKPAP
ncbi:MAG: large-conductance mechanosensitive channel protein MscL [Bdellovibrionaceae bacterium]|nr:large-conductance mechanosensitive channel protein MscL [Pseudobdellovibrionaceae bacterium]